MIETTMLITLYKKAEDGRLHFYTIHDRQPVLTARYALTAAWRVGDGKERERVYPFDTVADMDRKIRELFTRRIRDGYRLLYSFSRNPHHLPEVDDARTGTEIRAHKPSKRRKA